MKQLFQGGFEMIEISSIEYAFSKLNFEKAEKQKEKKKQFGKSGIVMKTGKYRLVLEVITI